PDEAGQRGPAAVVGELAQHAERLVEGDQHAASAAQREAFAAGFTKRRVMRSDSPMARYFARSASPMASVGGSVHTPLGWSWSSAGLALISLRSSSLKPASVASL